MTKNYFLLIAAGLALSAQGQNSLLTDPITGAIPSSGTLTDIEIIENGVDAVLIAANQTNKAFYAIDIQDNDWGDAVPNTVTSIPDFQNVIDGATGQSGCNIINIEVNTISQAVYVLATKGSADFIVKIEDNGATVSVLDQTNLTFCTINWGASMYSAQDITWGENKLFITSGSWTLDGEIAEVPAPFTHDMTTSNVATSMFKTNWGGGYFTDAPIERMDYAMINGEHRLMGVTVCAPGFSFETADIAGSGGLLEVEELFNVNSSPPIKVVHQNQGGNHYLFDLHSGPNKLVRIGEEYIDGSKIGDGDYNATAEYIRLDFDTPAPGLTDEQCKIYTETLDMISFWDDYNLLVLEADVLHLFETAPSAAGTIDEEFSFTLLPNPAEDRVLLRTNVEISAPVVKIFDLEGREIHSAALVKGDNPIDLAHLASGSYVVSVFDGSNKIYSDALVIR